VKERGLIKELGKLINSRTVICSNQITVLLIYELSLNAGHVSYHVVRDMYLVEPAIESGYVGHTHLPAALALERCQAEYPNFAAGELTPDGGPGSTVPMDTIPDVVAARLADFALLD